LLKKIINLFKKLIYNSLSTKSKNFIKEIINNLNNIGYHYNSIRKLNKNEKIRKESLLKFNSKPLISIIVLNYNDNNHYSLSSIYSVLKQEYSNWELIINNNPSIKFNLFKFFFKDPRIKFIKSLKSGTSSLEQISVNHSIGQFITFLTYGDQLRKDALYQFINYLNQEKKIDFSYSDEVLKYSFNKVPNFKPNFNEVKLLSHNYISNMIFFSKELLEISGGHAIINKDNLNYETIIHLTRNAKCIFHIPETIYYRKINKIKDNISLKIKNSKKAISEHLVKINQSEFQIIDGRIINSYHIKRKIKKNKKVSIIIPFKDNYKFTYNCVKSLIENTSYTNYEILLIDNASKEIETEFMIKHFIKYHKNIRSYRYDNLFNYSSINNFGVKFSKGEYILLLNNDTLIFRPDWLYELLQHFEDPRVGAVGPMLLYADNTIQHAGVVLGLGGLVGHIGIGSIFNSDKWSGRLILEHEVGAITGASLLTTKNIWNEIGGMDENFPVAYNDIDLCLRISEKNYKIIYNPYSILYHFESKSRGEDIKDENLIRFQNDAKQLIKKWGNKLHNDPFYSPNLTKLYSNMNLKNENEDTILQSTILKFKNPSIDVAKF
jgi:O-antigen biosynthesis protein